MTTRKIITKPQRFVSVVTVSIDTYYAEEASDAQYALDPYAVLRAKTESLAELLGISEEQAERLILERC